MFHVEHSRLHGKIRRIILSILWGTFRKVDRIALEAGRSAGFKSNKAKTKFFKGFGQLVGRRASISAAFADFIAYENASTKGCSACQDDKWRLKFAVIFCENTCYPSFTGLRIGYKKPCNNIFDDIKILLRINDALHPKGVFSLGALCTGGMNGRTAA